MNANFVNNTLPVTSTLLCYITNEITKTDFMSSVAYTENGIIKDTMFDTFLFLPSGEIVSQTNNKVSWDSFIRDRQYASGVNINALEQAAGEAKAALGRDFKVNVILSLWSPDKKIINFGKVNGKDLDLSKSEDRKIAMKYFIDEQIKHFKAKNFNNLNLDGFYWFQESIHSDDSETNEIIKTFTAYTRSLGYTSNWIPFNGAEGYATAKAEFGFDRVNMQGNFFPSSPGFPNNYAYSSWGNLTLDNVFTKYIVPRTQPFGSGLEMEFSGKTRKSHTGFKLYMLYAIKSNFTKPDYQAYYMDAGPGVIREIYNSEDSYFQSTYKQLYKFIKRTLKESDIVLIPADAAFKTVDLW